MLLLETFVAFALRLKIPSTSLADAEELENETPLAPSRLPIVFPVTSTRLVAPQKIPMKGAPDVVPLIAVLWLSAVIVFPCTLVAVLLPIALRSMALNVFTLPESVNVPVPAALAKPMILPVIWKLFPDELLIRMTEFTVPVV